MNNPKSTLGEAGEHLRQAARDTGDALRSAAEAAADELRVGRANVTAELADSALAGIDAAERVGDVARERLDAMMDKGRDLVDDAVGLIRERPLASFGVAFAAGWVISRLLRGQAR